jgi:nucleoside-diphosphate-sugar epimerase
MNYDNITYEIFCVGTSDKTSINDLFSIISKKYAKKYSARYLDERDGDILESVCDNSKLKKILKIEQMKKFEEGILKL